MTESAAAAALDRAVQGRGWRSQRARLHHAPGHCLVLALHTPGPASCPPEGTMCASVVHGGVLAQAGVTGRVPALTSLSLATARGGTGAKPTAVCAAFARLFSADRARNEWGWLGPTPCSFTGEDLRLRDGMWLDWVTQSSS